MNKALLALVLSAAAAVVGCKSERIFEAQVTEMTPGTFRQQWGRDLRLQDDPLREMHVRGDELFAYTRNNVLYRLNRKSGDVVFVSDIAGKGSTVHPPVIIANQVVVPADTKLHFLDQRGFLNRTIDLKTPIRTGVTGDLSNLYVGITARDGQGRLANVDINRLHSPFRWEVLTGGITSTPVVAQNAVYAGGDDGKVYAVSADRTNVWPIGTFDTAGRIVGNLAADKNTLYVASGDSKLYALALADGKTRWQYFSGTALADSPVVTETTVYVRVRDRGMVAIDKNEGGFNRPAKWAIKNATGFLAEDGQFVFLKDNRNHILAVDRKTGEVKFRSVRDDLKVFAVNPIDGLVYAATADGEVAAITPVLKHGTVGAIVWIDVATDQPAL